MEARFEKLREEYSDYGVIEMAQEIQKLERREDVSSRDLRFLRRILEEKKEEGGFCYSSEYE